MTTLTRRIMMAFAEPTFRWLWLASAFSVMSMMANGLTGGWLVLELTDSAFWVGAVAAFRGIGQVAFGIFAGVLLDRLEKRRVLILVQLLTAFFLALLGVLVFTGRIQLWHLLIVSLLQGMLISVRAPAFNTVVYQQVGMKRILNANAAVGLGFNIAMVVGSSLAGTLIERLGVAYGYYFAASAGLLAALAMFVVRGQFRSTARAEPMLQAAWSGVRYALTQARLRKLLTLSVIIEMFGFSYGTLLPVVARDVLGVGAVGLGMLSSVRGVGAMVSNLGVASLGETARTSRLLIGSVAGSGLFLMLFGFSPWYVLSLVLIFILGAMLTAYDVTIKSLFLLTVNDEWRERIQSIYTLTYGFGALSGFLIGWLATLVGASYTLATCGGIILSYIGVNRYSLSQADEPLEPAAEV